MFSLRNVLIPSQLVLNFKNLINIFSLKIQIPQSNYKSNKKLFIYGRNNFNQILLQIPIIFSAKFNGYRITAILSEPVFWIVSLYKKIGVEDFVFYNNLFHKMKNKSLSLIMNKIINKDITYRGVNIKKIIHSTLLRKEKVGEINFNTYDSTILEKQVLFCLNLIDSLDETFSNYKPDLFIFEDRGYIPEGIFFNYALNRGWDVIEFHTGHKPNLINLKRYNHKNSKTHPFSINKKVFSYIQNKYSFSYLKKKVLQELEECYETEKWFAEVGTTRNKVKVEKDYFFKHFNLDKKKKTACLFNHILWDATFFWGEDLFRNYQEWLLKSVSEMQKNSQINWLIKCHPANVVKNFRDNSNVFSEENILAQNFDNLPSNIKIIPSNSPFSTFSILKFIDFCITVRGTVGMEAACLNIPVLTAGTGRYDKFGFTFNSNSRGEYLRKLRNINNLKITKKHQHNSLIFTYATLFLKQLETNTIKYDFLNDRSANLNVRLNNDFSGKDILSIAKWLESKEEDLLNY